MTFRIGTLEMDYADYDAESDVLYLSAGGPRAGYGEETPEGHVLRFDENDVLYGVTLIGVRESMESEGTVRITPPDWLTFTREFAPSDLASVLA